MRHEDTFHRCHSHGRSNAFVDLLEKTEGGNKSILPVLVEPLVAVALLAETLVLVERLSPEQRAVYEELLEVARRFDSPLLTSGFLLRAN